MPRAEPAIRKALEALEAAAAIADTWATENFRLASDTVLLDPALKGGRSAEDFERSSHLCSAGLGHSYAAHAAQNIARAIRAHAAAVTAAAQGEG